MHASPPDHGVPPALLSFQRTLTAPDQGESVVALLASYDDYVNGGGPTDVTVHRGVPVARAGSWRLTVDIHVPSSSGPHPVMLYLHGGGWVMGAPASHRRLASELAALGVVVAVLDYRRAPKHRFPAAFDDTVLAVRWLAERAPDFGGDPRRLVLAGDSAGANLAAGVLATGSPEPVAAAVLLYGVFDFLRALPALAGLIGDGAGGQLYVEPDVLDTVVDDPRLSPERGLTTAAGYPPLLVLAGADDPLIEESRAYSRALVAAGADVQTSVIAGAPHGFLQLPTTPAHDDGLRTVDDFLRRHGVLAADR